MIKNILIFKVNCNLKLPSNYMKFMCFILSWYSRAWNYVPTTISKVLGYHLLQQMSSQWGLQKSLGGLVSHEHTAYIAVFELFLTQWIMVVSKVCKSYSLNYLILRNVALLIFEVLIQIVLNVNLFWSKFSQHSCSMWDKLEWLNWFAISLWEVTFL